MKRYKLICAAGFTFLCISLASVCAFAYWSVTGKTVNVLSMASYRAEIVEEYEIPSSVSPGVSVDKTVHVKNSGTVDMLIRIKIKKEFGVRNGQGELIPDASLDPELIELNTNDTWWIFKDGYWYYKEVLSAGNSTKEPLLTAYRVSEKAGNEYKGKDAAITVTLDSVQAGNGAASVWGIEEKDLGITYRSSYTEKTSGVIFTGQENGFSFSAGDTDLFVSFKNLLPGCARTQEIEVQNTSQKTVQISLAAEAANQADMTAKEKKLVQKLLQEYAVIEISQDGSVLYSGPVDGNLNGSGQTMQSPISLGSFAPSESKKLTVRLSLSTDMDSECAELTGKVCWVFTAGEDEASTGSNTGVYTPKTGDTAPILPFALIMSVSGTILLFTAARHMKKRPERSSI